MTDDYLIDRAIRAYTRKYLSQPCRSRSGVVRDFTGTLVVLMSVNGWLATYRYHKFSDRMRQVGWSRCPILDIHPGGDLVPLVCQPGGAR